MNSRPRLQARLTLMISALLISSLFFPTTAFAYVDPGSGSVIVTTILGLIAAVGYTVRKYYYKIKNTITGKKVEEEKPDDKQERS